MAREKLGVPVRHVAQARRVARANPAVPVNLVAQASLAAQASLVVLANRAAVRAKIADIDRVGAAAPSRLLALIK